MILSPFLDAGGVTLYAGDCIEVMRQLPEASVDAIVTDPPYALNFMGKKWDSFSGNPAGSVCEKCGNDDPVVGYRLCLDCLEAFDEQDFCGASMLGQVSQNWSEKATHSRGYADNNNQAFQRWTTLWAREAYRVLKPGGHLLAFAGTRTYHRMASGVEDAGFEIRDCIAWMYGSGFPKSLDVSKAIDKAAGADREDVYEDKPGVDDNLAYGKGLGVRLIERRPATPDAEKWSGWGTALKPAFEPVVVARKPLIGTVAQNVLEHGTGGLNVDGCRIETGGETWRGNESNAHGEYSGKILGRFAKQYAKPSNPAGRWPANVTLDETAAAMLDEQSGNVSYNPDGVFGQCKKNDGSTIYGGGSGIPPSPHGVFGYGDRGGPSRFFYTAKASKKDRNTNGANNTHPTVKPTTLMRWLIRLVTPPGGVILDPFGGSGSTGVAARAEGVRCILIEREAEYLDIIRQRLDDGDLFSALG